MEPHDLEEHLYKLLDVFHIHEKYHKGPNSTIEDGELRKRLRWWESNITFSDSMSVPQRIICDREYIELLKTLLAKVEHKDHLFENVYKENTLDKILKQSQRDTCCFAKHILEKIKTIEEKLVVEVKEKYAIWKTEIAKTVKDLEYFSADIRVSTRVETTNNAEESSEEVAIPGAEEALFKMRIHNSTDHLEKVLSKWIASAEVYGKIIDDISAKYKLLASAETAGAIPANRAEEGQIRAKIIETVVGGISFMHAGNMVIYARSGGGENFRTICEKMRKSANDVLLVLQDGDASKFDMRSFGNFKAAHSFAEQTSNVLLALKKMSKFFMESESSLPAKLAGSRLVKASQLVNEKLTLVKTDLQDTSKLTNNLLNALQTSVSRGREKSFVRQNMRAEKCSVCCKATCVCVQCRLCFEKQYFPIAHPGTMSTEEVGKSLCTCARCWNCCDKIPVSDSWESDKKQTEHDCQWTDEDRVVQQESPEGRHNSINSSGRIWKPSRLEAKCKCFRIEGSVTLAE